MCRRVKKTYKCHIKRSKIYSCFILSSTNLFHQQTYKNTHVTNFSNNELYWNCWNRKTIKYLHMYLYIFYFFSFPQYYSDSFCD